MIIFIRKKVMNNAKKKWKHSVINLALVLRRVIVDNIY